jgi:acyl dehydratase
VGRTFALAQPYEVEAAALRSFAAAVGATAPACFDAAAARALGYRDIVAAPTFAAVIAQATEALYVADPAAGIDFTRVVHAEERISTVRPLIAGDRVNATVHVVSVTTRATICLVTTRTDLTCADDGGPIAAVWSTLAIRPGDE